MEIVNAQNGEEAFVQIEKGFFDLVITDLKMPKMDGIQLTEAIRLVSSDTEVIWITAFSNDRTKAEAQRLGVQRFLFKPLDVADIRKIAREALRITMKEQANEVVLPESGNDSLKNNIHQLKVDTGAYAVLVITINGNLVETDGLINDLDVNSLSALIAGNFLAANGIAKLLGHKSKFKLSYHESDQHNIYSYGIGNQYLLVTVFGGETRPGIVWMYAQRAAVELETILAEMTIDDTVEQKIFHHLSEKVEHDLGDVLDGFWKTDTSELIPEKDQQVQQLEKTENVPPISKEAVRLSEDLLTFEEAIAKGVIPKDIVN